MGSKTNILILLLYSFLLPLSLVGQGSTNPFELTLPKNGTSITIDPVVSIDTAVLNAVDSTSTTPVKNNPFEIIRTGEPAEKETSATSTGYIPPFLKTQVEAAKKNDGRFLLGTVMFILLLLTPAVSLYNHIIKKAYRGFTNANFLKMIHRDQGAIVSFPYMLLYFLFFINAGFFVFLTVRHFDESGVWNFRTLLYFIVGVGLIFLIKHIFLKMVEGIFPVQKEVKLYSFSIIVFSIILGLVLIPINVFVAFGPESMTKVLIYIGMGVILAFYIYRTFRALFIGSKYISFHKFHFFMYICTVEIAPVLILAKLLFIFTGISW